jgi:hypothetical protein
MGIVSSVFYAATVLALAFFLHKVFWLVQYRRLQGELVERARKQVLRKMADDLDAWEAMSRACWGRIAGSGAGSPAGAASEGIDGPVAFVEGVEHALKKFRDEIRASRRSIENTLVKAIAEGKGSPDVHGLVLSLRRLSRRARDRMQVTVDLNFPSVITPSAPDKRLYELNVRSRYGFWRRALVFFSGAADVVYSSQHVALMSQNTHAPVGLLVRRLSLVFLIIFAVLLDWIFGLRTALAEAMDSWLGLHHGPKASFVEDNLGFALAMGLWLAAYGSIYLAAYFSIRRRYQANKRRLEDLRSHEGELLDAIRRRHVDDLVRWAREYARGLDNAVEVTLRHADTLVDDAASRVRRRVAAPALLEGARAVGEALFKQLPESHGGMEDGATTHKHSLTHYVWPREQEMDYQVQLTRYRAAWQALELGASELRRERPDPKAAQALWRDVIAYATMFQSVVPEGTAASLRTAYEAMVQDCVAQTEKDLDDLDARLLELARSLNEHLDCARPLVESKVELANQQIEGAVAALSAEIIGVREQARLEAMAFEI